MFYNLNSH